MSRRLIWPMSLVIALIVLGSASSVLGQGPRDEIEFTIYDANPILKVGASADWDGGSVTDPEVVVHDGLYHMFYTGVSTGDTHVGIGYATSTDGLVWQKHASNPILSADDTGFDATTVGWPVVLVDDDTCIMYFAGQDTYGGEMLIGRATAPDPSGPWTKDDAPVLMKGPVDTWDNGGIYPLSILRTGEGYRMYYAGGAIWKEEQTMVGLATSPDGMTWTKYDDPATIDPPFAESDPVLGTGIGDWQMTNIWGGDVRQTEDGWEMFYSQKGHPDNEESLAYYIDCATSEDGIDWTPCINHPLVSPEDDPTSLYWGLFADSVVMSESRYMLYYDYHWTARRLGGISVAIGTTSHD